MMASKHSLRIALARAVLAGDAEFYHFENGEERRGCHPKDVVTPEYLGKIVDRATNTGSSSSAAPSLPIKLRFKVPRTGLGSRSSPATAVDPQNDVHPFFYPRSFGTRKRKREAGQSIGVAAAPAQPRPTMSLLDTEILDLLEGTSKQQLSDRTSSDTATGASLTASQPRLAKQAIWVLAMIMHLLLLGARRL